MLKILLIICMALVPIGYATWQGYIEWYRRLPNMQVLVDGKAAGYVHQGKHSLIFTRTDIPGKHSYRSWETRSEVLIFDCHQWVAPDWPVFLQGRVSSPCTMLTSGSVTSPASPATNAPRNAAPEFTTRDGKVIHVTKR